MFCESQLKQTSATILWKIWWCTSSCKKQLNKDVPQRPVWKRRDAMESVCTCVLHFNLEWKETRSNESSTPMRGTTPQKHKTKSDGGDPGPGWQQKNLKRPLRFSDAFCTEKHSILWTGCLSTKYPLLFLSLLDCSFTVPFLTDCSFTIPFFIWLFPFLSLLDCSFTVLSKFLHRKFLNYTSLNYCTRETVCIIAFDVDVSHRTLPEVTPHTGTALAKVTPQKTGSHPMEANPPGTATWTNFFVNRIIYLKTGAPMRFVHVV